MVLPISLPVSAFLAVPPSQSSLKQRHCFGALLILHFMDGCLRAYCGDVVGSVVDFFIVYFGYLILRDTIPCVLLAYVCMLCVHTIFRLTVLLQVSTDIQSLFQSQDKKGRQYGIHLLIGPLLGMLGALASYNYYKALSRGMEAPDEFSPLVDSGDVSLAADTQNTDTQNTTTQANALSSQLQRNNASVLPFGGEAHTLKDDQSTSGESV